MKCAMCMHACMPEWRVGVYACILVCTGVHERMNVHIA